MEALVAVAVFVLGGLWGIAFKQKEAFDRLASALGRALKVATYMAVGATGGASLVNYGFDVQRVGNGGLLAAAGFLTLIGYLHFLRWIRDEPSGGRGDDQD